MAKTIKKSPAKITKDFTERDNFTANLRFSSNATLNISLNVPDAYAELRLIDSEGNVKFGMVNMG